MGGINMKKIHYAWVICAAGTLTMICNMGFCCTLLSTYLPYIVASGISGSAGSVILSTRSMATLVAMFIVGPYYSKVSLRTGISLSLLLAAVAMVLFSVGGSAPVYFVAAATAGMAFGLGGAIPLPMLIRAWFRGRRGTALGIVSAGSGVANICFPLIIERLVAYLGLRGMFWCAAGFVVLSALVVWLLVRNAPEELSLTPYEGGDAEAVKKAVPGNWELPAVGWALLVLLMIFQGGYSPSVSHLSVTMTGSGYTMEQAAFIFSFYGVAITVGKILYGATSDRIGARRTAAISYALGIGACLMPLLMDGQMLWPCAATALLLGVGTPPNSVGIAIVAAEISSPRTYANTIKWMEVTSILGSAAMGLVPGMFFDRFGSYQSAYMLMAVWSALCLPLLWLLSRSRKPVVVEEEA